MRDGVTLEDNLSGCGCDSSNALEAAIAANLLTMNQQKNEAASLPIANNEAQNLVSQQPIPSSESDIEKMSNLQNIPMSFKRRGRQMNNGYYNGVPNDLPENQNIILIGNDASRYFNYRGAGQPGGAAPGGAAQQVQTVPVPSKETIIEKEVPVPQIREKLVEVQGPPERIVVPTKAIVPSRELETPEKTIRYREFY
jgi:hypothetical protein